MKHTHIVKQLLCPFPLCWIFGFIYSENIFTFSIISAVFVHLHAWRVK